MTGLQKLAAVGAVSALSYAALRLSRIYNGIESFFKLPTVHGLIDRRYIRVIIPADIYNYTGQNLSAKSLHIVVKYLDKNNNEVTMGISPALEKPILLTEGLRSTPQFALDIDPFAFSALTATTQIKVYTRFTWGLIPVSVSKKMRVNDLIPQPIISIIQGILRTLGLGNSHIAPLPQITTITGLREVL